MAITNKIAVALVAVLIAAASSTENAAAEGMKDMLLDGLSKGQSEGEMTGDMARFFKFATKSNESVFVKIKRIREFENGCGRLRIEMTQAGVPVMDEKNKKTTATIDPWIEINICPDGQPPMEMLREMERKRDRIVAACKVSIEKSPQDKESGAVKATLRGEGCLESGMTFWRYNGSCKALEMPKNLHTETPIGADGKFEIQLHIPMQCLPVENRWEAIMSNKEKVVVGVIRAHW